MDSYDHNWHIMDSYIYIYIGYYFHIDQMLAIMKIFLPYISYIGYYVLSIWYQKKKTWSLWPHWDPVGIHGAWGGCNLSGSLQPLRKASSALLKAWDLGATTDTEPRTNGDLSNKQWGYIYIYTYYVTYYVIYNVNPGLINPLGCLVGGIPFKYHIVTIWRVPHN